MKLARQKPRYGYRRLQALLSRRGHEVNVKRVYRLYVEEGRERYLNDICYGIRGSGFCKQSSRAV